MNAQDFFRKFYGKHWEALYWQWPLELNDLIVVLRNYHTDKYVVAWITKHPRNYYVQKECQVNDLWAGHVVADTWRKEKNNERL